MSTADSRRNSLRKFMVAHGLKQSSWAVSAGVPESTLRSFLGGKSAALRHDTLEKLAKAAQVSIAELIGEQLREPRAGRDMIVVKGIKVTAALGGGVDVSDEAAGEPFYFRRTWIEQHIGNDPAMLRVIQLKGDSMEPTMHDGDVALVHVYGGNPAQEPGVYCLWDGHGLIVKRIQALPGKRQKLRILSDNATLYPPYEVDASDVRIVGRVIWRAGLV